MPRKVIGQFTIDMKLPSLNEVIEANRNNKYTGSRMKKKIETDIGNFITIAKCLGTLYPVGEEPIVIFIEWHEGNKRRDADNIESAQKFILDALQKYGILVKDSRKYVKQVYHKIFDDSDHHYSIVRLCEVTEDD